MPKLEWRHIAEGQGRWEYGAEYGKGPIIWLNPRPVYCDRGHWLAGCDGFPNLDHADAFPRYFMDLDRAKLECEDWFHWRLECDTKNGIDRRQTSDKAP